MLLEVIICFEPIGGIGYSGYFLEDIFNNSLDAPKLFKIVWSFLELIFY